MSKPVEPGSIVRLKSQAEIEMTVAVIGSLPGDNGVQIPAARCYWYTTRGELQDYTFPLVTLAVR